MSKKGFFGANGRLAQKKAEEEKKNQMEENGEVYVPIGKVLNLAFSSWNTKLIYFSNGKTSKTSTFCRLFQYCIQWDSYRR